MCFRSSFYGCIPIYGHDKSAPTAANSLPIMLLTDCNNTTFKKQNPYFRNVKTPFLQFKKVVFAIQKSSFCNSKECFLQVKKVVFAIQKSGFCRPKRWFLQVRKVVFVDPKVWFVVMNLGYSMVFSPFLNFILLQKCCVLNRRI